MEPLFTDNDVIAEFLEPYENKTIERPPSARTFPRNELSGPQINISLIKKHPETVKTIEKPKPIRFLRTLYPEEKTSNYKNNKSSRKRKALAIRVFNHISEAFKNNNTNINDIYEEDESVAFSQVQAQIDNKTDDKKIIVKKKKTEIAKNISNFDHLEIFRPLLNIMDEYVPDEKIFDRKDVIVNENTTKNINYHIDYELWKKSIMWTENEPDSISYQSMLSSYAGWVPVNNHRTWTHFLTNGLMSQDAASPKALLNKNMLHSLYILSNLRNDSTTVDPTTFFSLFPDPNYHLLNLDWYNYAMLDQDDILNRYDPTSEDISDLVYNMDQAVTEYVRGYDQTNMNKTSQWEGEFAPLFDSTSVLKEDCPKRMFLISSDEYYQPVKRTDQLLEAEIYNVQIKHSLPALDLQRTLFPTFMDQKELRRWHRPIFRPTDYGPIFGTGYHNIHNLKAYNEETMRAHQEMAEATGSGELFLMKTMNDLSPMHGNIILLEYSEEYPVLLSQIGMNSRIRIYVCKSEKDQNQPVPDLDYGDSVTIPPNISPFLGYIPTGESQCAIENNIYRAPIYRHSGKKTDFLIIANRNGYFIRSIPVIFAVGQELPKIEVPGPNSKASMRCARERLQTYIFRLFHKSKDNPKRIKIHSIRKAFTQHSENSIRKRLKLCADYQRHCGLAGDSNWWMLRNDFRLPTYEDMHEILQPEVVCGYYSMLAAQRRLKDAGYGKKSLYVAEEDNEEEVDANKAIDEEILCAPWHTSRAFIMAQKGKCLLAINGFADPTGCGEGYSFVRQSFKNLRDDVNKPVFMDFGGRKNKLITGTDADLRKLKLNQCRHILNEMGMPLDRIDKMQRWEMINTIRDMGSHSNKAGNLQDAIGKFARSARSIQIENFDKYKEECQTIFDLQNRCLSSNQEFSSEEDEFNEDASDIDELAKNLESMLNNKRESMPEYNIDEEEKERLDLIKLMEEGKSFGGECDDSAMAFSENHDGSIQKDEPSQNISRLLIHRTYMEDNKNYKRTTEVSDPRIIAAYLRIAKIPNYRQIYARRDPKKREDLRKNKKRLQDQIRRINRNVDKEQVKRQLIEENTSKEQDDSKSRPIMRCTACGGTGHMRTNRTCPRYLEKHPSSQAVPSDKSSDIIPVIEKSPEKTNQEEEENVIKVEGTRLVFGKALVEAAAELSRQSILLKIPKDSLKKRRKSEEYICDYLTKQYRNTSRRRADPLICLNAIFEEIVNRLKEGKDSWPFHHPVCIKKVPDYLNIIKNPMDFQTIKDNCKNSKYIHRDNFIEHIKLIYSNSNLYNGSASLITVAASAILQECIKLVDEKEQEILPLEKEINPLLSDDPQIKLSYILESIIVEAKTMSFSHPFLFPVSIKVVRDYYSYVQQPMDLETIRQQCSNNFYQHRDVFLKDVELIHSNSLAYNGSSHPYTVMASRLKEFVMASIEKNDKSLCEVEAELGLCTNSDKNIELEQSEQPKNESFFEESDNDEALEIMEDLQMSHLGSEEEPE